MCCPIHTHTHTTHTRPRARHTHTIMLYIYTLVCSSCASSTTCRSRDSMHHALAPHMRGLLSSSRGGARGPAECSPPFAMLCISVISIVSRILPSASSASSKIMRHAPTLGYSSVGQAPHHRSREAATDEDSACVAHHHESPPQPEGACIAPAPPSPTSAVLSPLAARRVRRR